MLIIKVSKKCFYAVFSLVVLFVVFSGVEVSAEENVEEVITPDDPEKFIEDMGWEKPHPDAELVEVKRVTNDMDESDVLGTDSAETRALSYYSVKNVRYAGESCGSIPRLRTSGTGGVDGVLTLGSSTTVSNTFSANVGVSANVVSAGVGFDVTNSFTRSSSYSVNTGGSSYQIVAYDSYNNFAFDVNNLFGSTVGSGNALKQIGFCYAAYKI